MRHTASDAAAAQALERPLRGQRRTIAAAGTVQLSLQVAALRDLRRRPPWEIHGDKRVWVAASFVSFLGPLAYFRYGRRG